MCRFGQSGNQMNVFYVMYISWFFTFVARYFLSLHLFTYFLVEGEEFQNREKMIALLLLLLQNSGRNIVSMEKRIVVAV